MFQASLALKICTLSSARRSPSDHIFARAHCEAASHMHPFDAADPHDVGRNTPRESLSAGQSLATATKGEDDDGIR
jgi:hypothetical protein